MRRTASAPLLLLCTARPGFHAPWPARAHHAEITLGRLNDGQTREIVMGVSARARLATSVIDAVVKRSDGVPLFTEELARLMTEGDGRSAAREIPATLHDSLTARLDRLGAAKEVAQIAAVIGREFSYELLHAVALMPEHALESSLDKLTDAELIYTRGIAPAATYQFKHALIQDAAYEALLKSRRREMHRRVAETMTGKFPVMAETQPEVIARHWTEAGAAEPALAAWKKAADAMYARRAFREAGDNYQRALEMLGTLPKSTGRDTRELELAGALAKVLMVTRGYSAPEAAQATARAHALAEKSGNLAQLIQQLTLARGVALGAGDHRGAAALADQISDLARREGSPVSVVFGHTSQLQVRFYLSDFAGVEEHFAHLMRIVRNARVETVSRRSRNPKMFRGPRRMVGGPPGQSSRAYRPGNCLRAQRQESL